jgi:hypothetical protein
MATPESEKPYVKVRLVTTPSPERWREGSGVPEPKKGGRRLDSPRLTTRPSVPIPDAHKGWTE